MLAATETHFDFIVLPNYGPGMIRGLSKGEQENLWLQCQGSLGHYAFLVVRRGLADPQPTDELLYERLSPEDVLHVSNEIAARSEGVA